MFPSNSNFGNNNDTVAYIDHSSILHRHFCNSSDIDIPPPIFQFPSPYYYNQCELEVVQEDHEVFHHQLHDDLLNFLNTTNNDSVSAETINMPAGSSKNEESTILDCSRNDQKKPTKRTLSKTKTKTKTNPKSKRDRHSKINTAKGPRDRRMRLSLHVARDFFGLQDILGYDKASRTVEWLLVQAEPEIKKLAAAAGLTQQLSLFHTSVSAAAAAAAAKSPPAASSTNSEAEVVSGVIIDKGDSSKPAGATAKGKKVRRHPRKTSFRPLIARDLRKKARARAKARTKEKIMWAERLSKESNNNIHLNNKLMCSWSTTHEESAGYGIHQDQNIININPSLQTLQAAVAEVKDLSPNWIFNCMQNFGINQEHQQQHTGFLSFGKPWEEAYNNRNM